MTLAILSLEGSVDIVEPAISEEGAKPVVIIGVQVDVVKGKDLARVGHEFRLGPAQFSLLATEKQLAQGAQITSKELSKSQRTQHPRTVLCMEQVAQESFEEWLGNRDVENPRESFAKILHKRMLEYLDNGKALKSGK